MAWDFLRNGRTGDWVFAGNGDVAGISGYQLTQQRVQINLKIPRGTFIYDVDKVLGSRLYDLIRHDIERGVRDMPDVIREALENMSDITVDEIQTAQNGNSVIVKIIYHANIPVLSGVITDTQSIELIVPFPSLEGEPE
jgi:hypothetical protein